MYAFRYNSVDCSTGQVAGPYDGDSDARRYVQCPGQPNTYWTYDEADLWLDMWGSTGQTGCFTAYYLVLPMPNDPRDGCPSCQHGGKIAGDPIDVATGNMFLRETDFVAADPRLRFTRVYNSRSTSAVTSTIGQGWTSELDGGHILAMEGAFPKIAQQYVEESSKYVSAGDACAQGMAEVAIGGKSGRADPRWAGVTGVYDGAGHCQLSNGMSVPVFGTGASAGLATSTDGITRGIGVRRPDGSRYMFHCVQGVCTLPALSGTVPFTITVDTAGYTINDDNGNQEHYDYLGFLNTLTYKDGYQLSFTYDNDIDGTGLLAGGVGTPLSIVDNHGRAITFGYDANGLLSTVSTPDGQTIQYTHYANGELQSVATATGTRTYQYTDPNFPYHLTGLVDENGKLFSTWSYDSLGRATSNALAGGVDSVSLTFNAGNTVEIGALGAQHTYNFVAPLGYPQISTIVGPACDDCGLGAANSYDGNGWLASSTDWNGNVTAYQFDDAGQLHQRIDGQGTPQQRTTTIDWDDVLRNPRTMSVQGAAGDTVAQSAWTYNARGEPLTLARTDPASGATRTWSYHYCEQADIDAGTCPLPGLLTSIDGPHTDVADITTYTYYASDDPSCAGAPTTCPHRMGDLWKRTNALGQTITVMQYDGAGRPLSLLDANGMQTDLQYNARGWLQQVAVRATNGAAGTGDAVTGYAYDKVGNLTQITRPDHSFVIFSYDAAHRLTDIADNLGDKIHYTLDNAGNRTREDTKDPTGALKHSVVRQFNALSQLVKTFNADGSTLNASYHYDPNGNPDVVTDGRGTVTNYQYDALNRRSHIETDPGAAPHVEANVLYTLDALDRITQVTDPQGLNTSYQFDGLGNPTQLTSPDTGTAKATFDAAGNLRTRTDARGIKASYTYDALNRVQTIRYPTAALAVTYTYDATPSFCNKTTQSFGVGRLTSISDGSGSTALCYDRFGNLVVKQQVIAGKVFLTRYAYDKAHRLTQLITPTSTVVNYTRDGIGRIVKVTAQLNKQAARTVVSQVTYNPFGPVASITYGDGRTLTRHYDADYVVSAITDPTAGGLNLGFGRDAIGNLTRIASGATGNKLAYDGLNRLTNVTDLSSHPQWTYTYDATGNRLSAQQGTQAAVPYTYQPSTHQLYAVGTTLRGYDAMGDTTLIGSGATAQAFHYDDTGRMDQLQTGTGTVTMQYATNALGQRVEKYLTGNAALTQYTIRDEAGQAIADYDGSSNRIRETIWMDGLPVGVLTGTAGTLSYLEPDQLGTPRVAIDATSNAATWNWNPVNDPFGQTQPTGTLSLNLRLPGQVYDGESGMAYNYFRDYEPATGRFPESDPLGLRGGISTYSYVGGSPLMFSDRFGLAPGDIFNSPEATAQDMFKWANYQTYTLHTPGWDPHNESGGWIISLGKDKSGKCHYTYRELRPGNESSMNHNFPDKPKDAWGFFHDHTLQPWWDMKTATWSPTDLSAANQNYFGNQILISNYTNGQVDSTGHVVVSQLMFENFPSH